MMTTKERHEVFLEEMRKPLQNIFGRRVCAGNAQIEDREADDPTEESEEDPA